MQNKLFKKKLHYRWIIFILLSAGYYLVMFHRICPAILAVDMMEDLHVGGGLAGLLSSAYFYPYALMQLAAGLFSDLWGARKTVTTFFIIASIGSLVLGLSSSIFWAILGRILVGIGVSMLFVPAIKIFSEWYSTEEFATLSGIFMSVGGLGMISATVPLALLSSWIGWRLSFIFIAVVTFLLAILFWFFVKDHPPAMRRHTSLQRMEKGSPPTSALSSIKAVITRIAFWPVAIWFFFDCGVFFSFGGLDR